MFKNERTDYRNLFPFPNQIYVTVSNDQLTIRFCDVPIATNMGLCTYSYIIRIIISNTKPNQLLVKKYQCI